MARHVWSLARVGCVQVDRQDFGPVTITLPPPPDGGGDGGSSNGGGGEPQQQSVTVKLTLGFDAEPATTNEDEFGERLLGAAAAGVGAVPGCGGAGWQGGALGTSALGRADRTGP